MRFSITAIIATLSLGTQVFAAPAPSSNTTLEKRDASSAITVISGAIGKLQTDVKADLQAIAAAVVADQSPSVIPIVQQNLGKITTSYITAISTILPQLVGISTNLTAAELQLLLASVKTYENVVTEIQAEFQQLISKLSANALAFVKPQLETVVNIASILSNSIVSYAQQAANAVLGPNGVVAQLQAATVQIKNIISGLFSQVQKS